MWVFIAYLPPDGISVPRARTRKVRALSSHLGAAKNPRISLLSLLVLAVVGSFVCHPVGICFCLCCCSFSFNPPKQTSSRPEQRTVVSSAAQWRDPCISVLA